MLKLVYSQPLWLVGLEILLLVILWVLGERWTISNDIWKNRWKWMNRWLAIFVVAVILGVTLGVRTEGMQEVCVCPFYSLVMAQEQPEVYRSMLMNVFLFVPFGLSISQNTPERWAGRKRFICVVFCSLILSCFVETMQFFLCLGRTEVDDIIMNTLGGAIGAASVLGEKDLFVDKRP